MARPKSSPSRLPRTCEQCGAAFAVTPAKARAGRGRFCSRRCKYDHARRGPLAQRFWQRVDVTGGAAACWPWTGRRLRSGYGTITGEDGEALYAHRVSWALANGPIPAGLVICHQCDTPPCCNPAHLWLGTIAQNTADMVTKGRQQRLGSRRDPRPGERSNFAVLTEALVREVRTRRAAGVMVKTLAAEYGVHPNTITRITQGRTWARVP